MNKISIKDVKVSDESYARISLVKLTGLKIKDIEGYISTEFSKPTFKQCKLIFENGIEMYIEGEHDFPYLEEIRDQTPPNMDEKTLQELYDEDNSDEMDEIEDDDYYEEEEE